jgi:hypothetical protein
MARLANNVLQNLLHLEKLKVLLSKVKSLVKFVKPALKNVLHTTKIY